MSGLFEGKWLQCWQYGPPYAAETGLAETITLAKTYGFSGLLLKAFDGAVWQGDYDHSPDALRGYGQLQKQTGRIRAAGLTPGIWVNPLFGGESHLLNQAAMYATAGNITGLVAFDVEPFAGFWGAGHPEGPATLMMTEFRRLAPNVITVSQPDPRSANLAAINAPEWAPWMNVYAPQLYAADFQDGQPASAWVIGAMAGQNAISEYAPTLNANETPGNTVAALDAARRAECQAAILWRLGTAGLDTLAAWRDAQLYVPSVPLPADCADERARIAAAVGMLDRELARKRLRRLPIVAARAALVD